MHCKQTTKHTNVVQTPKQSKGQKSTAHRETSEDIKVLSSPWTFSLLRFVHHLFMFMSWTDRIPGPLGASLVQSGGWGLSRVITPLRIRTAKCRYYRVKQSWPRYLMPWRNHRLLRWHLSSILWRIPVYTVQFRSIGLVVDCQHSFKPTGWWLMKIKT